MISSSIVFAAVAAIAAFILGATIFSMLHRRRDSKTEVHVSLERIKEMGELTVMTAYIKEVVTMKTEADNPISTTGKIILICAFDIEFRYDLRRITISKSPTSDSTTIILPPHFIKSIPKKTEFYDERKAAYLGFWNVDFSVEERNRLINEAASEAIKQAGVLQGDLQEKVRSSAKATLSALAHAFGTPDIQFAFEDSASVVQQISGQLDRSAG